ncbi:MAG: DUF3310 domain-containing protein [Escherichia coli]|nr:DUF3310 domain-containing protein [Escherichia coli]MBL1007666.1 DUF3310 domain-containing protein [Escherichia coli]
MEFKKGQTYICTESHASQWTEGKEYKVYFSSNRHAFALSDNNLALWYEDELNEGQHKFKLKEEKQMLKFKKGQTYICTESHEVWWTKGKEYKVVLDVFPESLVIKDNEGTSWYDYEINESKHKFKLKEETETTDLIDNQSHYKNQGIEPIELMRANFSNEEFAGFLQGNVLKYMLRYKDKNGVEDLKKAKTYLTWLIEVESHEPKD